jgi:signal transduction histidine kinase
MNPAAGLRRWWVQRSIALRVTIAATAVLGAGLLVGVLLLAVLFARNRIATVDQTAVTEADTLVGLVSTGQLPDPLPAPADQPVLAQVVDPDGSVVSATPSAGRVPILPVSELARVHDRGPFTSTATALGSAPLRVVVRQVSDGSGQLTVVTAVPYADVQATLEGSLAVLVIAVPIAIVAAGVAIWLAVTSSLRPVDAMSSASLQISDAGGPMPPRLPVPDGDDEVTRLALALNAMLDRLHRATEAQRAFVADSAHELRSPIASIRTQLDVALATSTSRPGWEEVARGVQADVTRLGDLVEDLLLLARLDAAAPQRVERVDLRQVLDLEGGPLWIEADPRTIRRAYDNVVSNAERHARHKVVVRADRDGDRVVVTVDDDGDGVAPHDRERVFERWVRLDEARSRDEGGVGLGLALARAIARSHGGDLTLDAGPLGGARVTLTLPAA